MERFDGLSAGDATTWSAVFDQWKQDEHANPAWKKSWESKGYGSWEEWRSHRSNALSLADRAWTIARIEDPLRTVPTFYGGPFKTWIDRYYGSEIGVTFSELTKLGVRDNPRIQVVVQQFPVQTRLIGLLWQQRMLIYEGMHRACAIAIAAEDGLPFTAHVDLAYADISDVSEEELRRIAAINKKDVIPSPPPPRPPRSH